MTKVHSTAIVDPKAELAEDVEIAAWAQVGPKVRIGPNCKIGPRVLVDGDTELGNGCRVYNGAIVGTDPQDLKYRGESSKVVVGNGVTIREFVTINRACGEDQSTVVGNNVLIMAYAHVAHNCEIQDDVIMANAATLAGHIRIGYGAIIGGLVAIHQFVQIGRLSIVGGSSGVNQDVLPFITVSGFPCRPYGLNRVGLKRHGFSNERIKNLRAAYRSIFRSGLKLDEAIAEINERFPNNKDIKVILDFINNSKRALAR